MRLSVNGTLLAISSFILSLSILKWCRYDCISSSLRQISYHLRYTSPVIPVPVIANDGNLLS